VRVRARRELERAIGERLPGERTRRERERARARARARRREGGREGES
jgi:hypothetical protein